MRTWIVMALLLAVIALVSVWAATRGDAPPTVPLKTATVSVQQGTVDFASVNGIQARRIEAGGVLLADTEGILDGTAAEDFRGPFRVGVCTHFSQGKGLVDANLRSMNRAGITTIRDEATWGAIERTKGELAMPERLDGYVRQASAAGLEVMLILDYANRLYDDGDRPRSETAIEGFCNYAEFLVRHFGNDVRLYEVWNEWDIGIGMPEPYNKGGSPEDYVQLLAAVYPRIKAIDPQITVMAGSCTSGGAKKGWLEEIVRLGALDYCDAISVHAYNYGNEFPDRTPEACSVWLSGVQEMLRGYNDGIDFPFYVTEVGWPNHVGKRTTDPELSASYLARLYLLARTSSSFRGLWWYDFQDDGWEPGYNESNFGIVRPNLTPKPAYYVMADISDLLAHGDYVDRLGTEDTDLWILRFKHLERDVWALWSSDDAPRQVILHADNPSASVTIHEVGHKQYESPWGYRDWASARNKQAESDQLSLVVSHRPFLVSGSLSGVSVLETIPRRHEEAVGDE